MQIFSRKMYFLGTLHLDPRYPHTRQVRSRKYKTISLLFLVLSLTLLSSISTFECTSLLFWDSSQWTINPTFLAVWAFGLKGMACADFSTSPKTEDNILFFWIYSFVVLKDTVNFTWDRVRKGTDCLLATQELTVRASCIVVLSHLKEVGPRYHAQ